MLKNVAQINNDYSQDIYNATLRSENKRLHDENLSLHQTIHGAHIIFIIQGVPERCTNFESKFQRPKQAKNVP